MQGAWKVGLLVVIFVGLLLGAYSILGRSLFAQKTTTLYAVVPDVTGVNVGAPVLLAGVKVGQVSAITLETPKLARLTFAMNEDARIPAGSTVQIPTPLLGLGDNPVYIVPPETVTTAMVEPGATLQGSRLSAFEGILPDLDATVSEVNKTLIATRELITDARLRNNLNTMIETGTETIDKFGMLATNFQGIIAENRGSLKASMRSVQSAMVDVQRSAALVKDLLADPQWRDQAQALLASMDKTVLKANELLGSVDALINDPNIRQPMHETLANVKTITDTGTRIAENSEKITAEGITIAKNVSELTAKANELAEEAKGVLKKISDFFNKVPTTGGLRGLEAGMDLIHESAPNHWRMDITAKMPIGDRTLHLGLHDAFEGNRINAQLGKSIGRGSEYRYGVYASKPGLGVDFRVARDLVLKGDLYDINDPRLDLGVRYEFKDGLLGWLGFNRVFDRNAFYAGLGFRR